MVYNTEGSVETEGGKKQMVEWLVPVGTGIKTLVELGQVLARVIGLARDSSPVELRVLLYLRVAQAAIQGLGRERQKIISDASICNIRDREEVGALRERMTIYLTQDNVRFQLQDAIEGLRGCHEPIERAAQGGLIRWRKRDKRMAVNAFMITLSDLENQLQNLVYDYSPQFSGMGVPTLEKVYKLIERVCDDLRQGLTSDAEKIEADEEELVELVQDALLDPAQFVWREKSADIERLIVQLQLAFSVPLSIPLGKI
jgi:hypothetical protein